MKIGVLTSGGDAPGMNAAIRSVVRQTIADGHRSIGFFEGFRGLIDYDYIDFSVGDVSGIIDRGGTMLRTSRCVEFLYPPTQEKVTKRLLEDGIKHLVVIGGDGSCHGASILNDLGLHVVAVPASIDDDLYGTDTSIGFDTALNTVINNLSKIRDTASALERVFVVEVMGRDSGAIALYAGLTGGADNILLPGRSYNIEHICESIDKGFKRGKGHSLTVVAEGAGSAYEIGEQIKKCSGFDVKITILGHIQRGGSPSARDRFAASVLGSEAAKILIGGGSGVMVGLNNDVAVPIPFKDVMTNVRELDFKLIDLAKTLSI